MNPSPDSVSATELAQLGYCEWLVRPEPAHRPEGGGFTTVQRDRRTARRRGIKEHERFAVAVARRMGARRRSF